MLWQDRRLLALLFKQPLFRRMFAGGLWDLILTCLAQGDASEDCRVRPEKICIWLVYPSRFFCGLGVSVASQVRGLRLPLGVQPAPRADIGPR